MTMMKEVSARDAVERLRARDSLGLPLGPGQPGAFVAALGERDDWSDLRIFGALLTVPSQAFSHPNVRYLSGFFGPAERWLRDSEANIGFVPVDFRRMAPLYEALRPRVMATAAAPPDERGLCSLSLHAGGTIDELLRAGRDPERLLVVEASQAFPRTHGLAPDHPHGLAVEDIDLLVRSEHAPAALPETAPTDVDRAIAGHARTLIPHGATLQTGIGTIPSTIATLLAEGDGGDYGVHSEMFTTGLMRLHEAGKVSNRKGQFDGVSVATFAFGSSELYAWLDGNEQVAFLPVDVVNSPEAIARNRLAVTINGALAIDVHGQIVADTIGGAQYSGTGGHEDFVSAPALALEQQSLVCLPSTVTVDGQLRSRIAPFFDAGTVITTPRHQVEYVVTEHGVAELMGRTVDERARALAAVAHPDFREELLAAAERAARGHSPVGDRSASPPSRPPSSARLG